MSNTSWITEVQAAALMSAFKQFFPTLQDDEIDLRGKFFSSKNSKINDIKATNMRLLGGLKNEQITHQFRNYTGKNDLAARKATSGKARSNDKQEDGGAQESSLPVKEKKKSSKKATGLVEKDSKSTDPHTGEDKIGEEEVAKVERPLEVSARKTKVIQRVEMTGRGKVHSQWRTTLKDLIRGSVRSYRVTLKVNQGNSHGYYLRSLDKCAVPEVDHTFECQAMGEALIRCEHIRPVLRGIDFSGTLESQPYAVRDLLAPVKQVHNHEDYLALIDKRANDKKQGAFQRALRLLETKGSLEDTGGHTSSLESMLYHNFCNGINPYDDTEAAALSLGVIKRLKDIEDPLTARLRECYTVASVATVNTRRARFDAIADEVVQLYDDFGL